MARAAGDHIAEKVILITGAGSGFGREIARQAADLGAAIVGSDVDAAAVEATAAAIVERGGRAEAVVADVTVKEDMDRVVAAAVERFGAVDVLVNNAGVMPLAFFADHERAWEAWDRAIDINVKGVVHGIAAVFDQMMEQGRGHVVNISSIYGNRGTAGSGVYSATKAAVVVLSDALRVESQGRIKVTVVRPTGVLGTNLGSTVVNYDAFVGITGEHTDRFGERVTGWMSGDLPDGGLDLDSVRYWTLSPEDLAGQVVAVIDTPWGLDISDVTVRATGEDYVI